MTEESEAEKSAETASDDPSEATDAEETEAKTTAHPSGADSADAKATEPGGDDGGATELDGDGGEAAWLLELDDGGDAAGSAGGEGDEGGEVLGEEGGDEAEEIVVSTPSIDAPLSSAGRRLGGLVLDTLLFVVTAGIGWIVWSLRVWARGQTPAKSLLSMRVVTLETGRAAKWSTMARREAFGAGLLTVITAGITALVSCFLILGESRQGVWDRIAGTVVVDDKDDRLLR